ATGLIQDPEKAAGLGGGVLDPASQGGATGATGGGQDDRQQHRGLLEAQAEGGGDGDAVALLGLGEVDGLLEGGPQLPVLVTELLPLPKQLLPRRAAGVEVADRLLHALRVFVSGLAAAAGLPGLGGDR